MVQCIREVFCSENRERAEITSEQLGEAEYHKLYQVMKVKIKTCGLLMIGPHRIACPVLNYIKSWKFSNSHILALNTQYQHNRPYLFHPASKSCSSYFVRLYVHQYRGWWDCMSISITLRKYCDGDCYQYHCNILILLTYCPDWSHPSSTLITFFCFQLPIRTPSTFSPDCSVVMLSSEYLRGIRNGQWSSLFPSSQAS